MKLLRKPTFEAIQNNFNVPNFDFVSKFITLGDRDFDRIVLKLTSRASF